MWHTETHVIGPSKGFVSGESRGTQLETRRQSHIHTHTHAHTHTHLHARTDTSRPHATKGRIHNVYALINNTHGTCTAPN